MNLTTLFRLRKPEGTDPVNIEDFNDNFDVIDTELGKRPLKTDSASDMTVAFTQASSRANLTTGEKLSVSLGKIMKFFTDLKEVAFSGSYTDLSNKPTIPSGTAANCQVVDDVDDIKAITVPGYVPGTLPLKQVISDFDALTDSGAITGMDAREDGVYITYVPSDGADAVTRKLGSSIDDILIEYFSFGFRLSSSQKSGTVSLAKDGYQLVAAAINQFNATGQRLVGCSCDVAAQTVTASTLVEYDSGSIIDLNSENSGIAVYLKL